MSKAQVLELFRQFGTETSEAAGFWVSWQNLFKLADAIEAKAEQKKVK